MGKQCRKHVQNIAVRFVYCNRLQSLTDVKVTCFIFRFKSVSIALFFHFTFINIHQLFYLSFPLRFFNEQTDKAHKTWLETHLLSPIDNGTPKTWIDIRINNLYESELHFVVVDVVHPWGITLSELTLLVKYVDARVECIYSIINIQQNKDEQTNMQPVVEFIEVLYFILKHFT